tara:strand:- start:19 stop:624 length:606 start_codon:yes stop_codon:yes gene_type:complete
MPKNTKGGSGHKRQARKHTSGGYQNNRTRFSDDPLEMYAVCTKLYGQGHIEVMCHDGVSRMCVIRKKFKGRGKRDNNIILGTWLLVGKREFEVRAAGKKEKCDLLEVYRDNDKVNLQQHESDIPWSVLKSQAPEGTEAEDDDVFQFVDERTQKYTDMLENVTLENTKIVGDDNSKGAAILEADDDDSVSFGKDGEIDIDDI